MENCMQIAFEKIYYVFSIGWHSIWKANGSVKEIERGKEKSGSDLTNIFCTSWCLMRVQSLLLCFSFVVYFLHLFLVYCFATRSLTIETANCIYRSNCSIREWIHCTLTMLHARINLFICEKVLLLKIHLVIFSFSFFHSNMQIRNSSLKRWCGFFVPLLRWNTIIIGEEAPSASQPSLQR